MSYLCVTVKQPWASLIIHGGKDVENRSRRLNYRGRLYIHSSAKLDKAEFYSWQALRDERCITLPVDHGLAKFSDLPRGQVIGYVEVADCVEESPSPWFTGQFGWILQNPTAIEPFHARGRLGLWRLP